MNGKLKAAAGLAMLQANKYKQAARRFSEVSTRADGFMQNIHVY